MNEYLKSEYAAFIIIGVSLVLGWLCQKIFTRYFSALANRTRWHWDDIVIRSIGRFPLYWCLLGGCYVLKSTQNLSLLEPGQRVFLDNLLSSVMIFTVTVVAARLVGGAVGQFAEKTSGRVASTSLFSNGFRILVYVVGAIIILQNLDIQITPIVTALGLGGLAVALALEETLNNLFCGIQIVVTRFIRLGDYVKLESGHEGYITDIKARNTTIRSFPDHNRIIVPNSKMASSIVTNFSMPERNLWITIPAGVSYDSDLDHVEEVTLEVAKEVLSNNEAGLSDHEPVFLYGAFGDSSINFTIRLFVKRFRDQFVIQHEFIKALHKRYSQENIEIPFPIRTLYMNQDHKEE